jgi:hypothetical protein
LYGIEDFKFERGRTAAPEMKAYAAKEKARIFAGAVTATS